MEKQGSSDFFGNDDSPQIIDSTNYSSCFHIYISPLISNRDTIICKRQENIPHKTKRNLPLIHRIGRFYLF